MTERRQRVEEIPSLDHEQWIEVGRSQHEALLKLLRDLSPEDWHASTDCELWTVKDMTAHVLGAAEGFTSFRELRQQVIGSLSRRGELGSQLNAMNQVQVDDRRHLSPDELTARLEDALPKFLVLRGRVGGIGRYLPLYDPNLGAGSVRYLMDTIFSRDHFMHRIDIERATQREIAQTESDRLLVADVVVDWTRRAHAHVTLELSGDAGGSFVAGSGAIGLAADALELCRVLSGRGDISSISVDGDRDTAARWLKVGCPF